MTSCSPGKRTNPSNSTHQPGKHLLCWNRYQDRIGWRSSHPHRGHRMIFSIEASWLVAAYNCIKHGTGMETAWRRFQVTLTAETQILPVLLSREQASPSSNSRSVRADREALVCVVSRQQLSSSPDMLPI